MFRAFWEDLPNIYQHFRCPTGSLVAANCYQVAASVPGGRCAGPSVKFLRCASGWSERFILPTLKKRQGGKGTKEISRQCLENFKVGNDHFFEIDTKSTSSDLDESSFHGYLSVPHPQCHQAQEMRHQEVINHQCPSKRPYFLVEGVVGKVPFGQFLNDLVISSHFNMVTFGSKTNAQTLVIGKFWVTMFLSGKKRFGTDEKNIQKGPILREFDYI